MWFCSSSSFFWFSHSSSQCSVKLFLFYAVTLLANVILSSLLHSTDLIMFCIFYMSEWLKHSTFWVYVTVFCVCASGIRLCVCSRRIRCCVFRRNHTDTDWKIYRISWRNHNAPGTHSRRTTGVCVCVCIYHHLLHHILNTRYCVFVSLSHCTTACVYIWEVFSLSLCVRLSQQQISELRSQIEELQRALQEQDSKTEDVSTHTQTHTKNNPYLKNWKLIPHISNQMKHQLKMIMFVNSSAAVWWKICLLNSRSNNKR